jgi:hypothetical protein
VLLCGFETAIVDESQFARALTAAGNAARTTTQAKYGTASCTFDGTGDRINFPLSTDFQFGAGDYTVEAFFRPLVKASNQAIVGIWHNSGVIGQAWWQFWVNGSALGMRISSGGATVDYQTTWTPTLGTWYHVAACRASDGTRIFVDGNAILTTLGAAQTINSTQGAGTNAAIGSVANAFSTYDLNGQLDEIRVTKGVARYTANFTPPAAAFPRG